MDKQQTPQQQPPKDSIETEIRKPRKGKKNKVSFNLKIEEKDVKIFFH
jgi:hypothetical protein